MATPAFLPRKTSLWNPQNRRGGFVWSIILAGGEGTRMRPMIARWLGAPRPKQYCVFAGSRSMLQHTLDRARAVSPPERTLLVIGSGHRPFLRDALAGDFGGLVLEQPGDFGTAPGVLLPLVHILERDPDATVLILPSDHFVHPESRFAEHLKAAVALANALPDRLTLIAARPDGPETDYGWIEPAPVPLEAHPGGAEVVSFYEKPDAAGAERFFLSNWLWNTMVVGAKARRLFELADDLIPATARAFEPYRSVLKAVDAGHAPADHLQLALDHIYKRMVRADFSGHILQAAPETCVVLPMEGVSWSDWGRPERIAATLVGLGTKPAFSMQAIQSLPAST